MIVSDIETDGLLDVVGKFHCAWTYDYKTGEYNGYRPNEFSKYIEYIEQKASEDELIVFHNGIGYDHQALNILTRKLLKRELNVPSRNILDTLVLSKILYQNLKGSDMGLIRAKRLSPKNLGKHSLDAWGQRLGELKGDYKDTFKANVIASGEDYQAGDEWLLFNEAMYDYNKQDVVVGKALLDKFLSDTYYFNENVTGTSTATEFWENTLEAIEVEHRAAWLMVKMHNNGFPMDINIVRQIESEARVEHSKILIELVEYFGSWWEPKGGKAGRSFYRDPVTGEVDSKAPLVVYPKSGSIYTKSGTLAKSLYCKGAPYTPVQFITFNPSSRDHIRLMLSKAGWEPTEFTETGAPKVDDEALASVKVDDPIAQKSIELIRRYLMIDKRLGQVADGNNAWLKHYNEETKCIHGSVNPNGTVTTRATHHRPNMGQIPKPSFDDATKEMLRGMAGGWGAECREAFGAAYHDNWYQAGTDASGLELRTLGHYLYPFDNGEYSDTAVNGDIHTKNQIAAGLPSRDNAKTFIYGYLYGAGDAKVGSIVGGTKAHGKELKAKFLKNTPALKLLRDSIERTLVKSSTWIGGSNKVQWRRRFVKSLDGRKIFIRSPHSALNAILQSAGAAICKYWILETERILVNERGYKHGWDGDFAYMMWVHDEIQVACRTKELAEEVIEVAQIAMRRTQEHYNVRCQLDTEGKVGATWLDCH